MTLTKVLRTEAAAPGEFAAALITPAQGGLNTAGSVSLANFSSVAGVTAHRPAVLAVVALGASYLANAFGTLRLNTDAVTILGQTLSDLEGQGRMFHGQPATYPPGVPFLIEALTFAGSASTFSLVLMNLLFLLTGVIAFFFLCPLSFPQVSRRAAFSISILTLLSWAVIKHAPIPLTDMPYFGFAMLSLFVTELARRTIAPRKALLLFLAAFALIFASIAMRRTGIALVPALLPSAIAWEGGRWWSEGFSLRIRLGTGGLLAAALLLLTFWWASTATLTDYAKSPFAGGAVFASTAAAIQFRIKELAEVAINVPASKLPEAAGLALPVLGTLIVCALLAGVYRITKLNAGLGVCETYCLGYSLIIVVWPYPDARFFVPLIPFILLYGLTGIESIFQRRARSVQAAWAISFCLAGVLALIYSTSIAISGPEFPLKYGDGTLRDTYCAHQKTCNSFGAARVDADALKILRIFDAR